MFGYRWQYYAMHPWRIITETYYNIKWFIQRGKRGWADCDGWGVDSYLESWLPGALRNLKNGPGWPMEMCDEWDDSGNCPHQWQIHATEWDAILEQIAQGFEAGQRIKALGVLPGTDEYEQCLQIKNNGLYLFVKYFDNLWA